MSMVLRLCLFAIVLSWTGFSYAAEKPFFHGGVARDAQRFEANLKRTAEGDKSLPEDWRDVAELARKNGIPRVASELLRRVALTNPDDAGVWLMLAESLLATKPKNSNERYNLPYDASSAAFIGYRRAKSKAEKAKALALLGEALKRRSFWRPALNAYKASLALADDFAVKAHYETLRAEHGFRVVDYSVDSDAASPRLCIQFSEALGKGQIDFAKFIRVDGKAAAAVSADDQQICVDGLEHGKRYKVAVRSGLPSAVDEALIKTSELVVYVRDRSPAVRFSGRNYVLPNRGQQGIPLVSVNTELLAVELYRIGDRNLAKPILEGDVQRQLSAWDVEQLRNKSGQKVWSGEMPVKSKLNEDVTTAFPVNEAIGRLDPGVYVMIARAKNATGKASKGFATQWFVVSDLGLTAYSGHDGIHAFVRSLAGATPTPGVVVRLIARNNEVLATVRTNDKGYAHFKAGLTRGEGGAEPAILVAKAGDTDYAFLDLTGSSFDLTDRGVAGRAAPGPLDAYIFSERGIYKPGADVFITALLRDRNGRAAKNIPLTMIVKRPDGVEHRRVVLKDQGVGGRVTTLKLAASSMTGTWRVRVYADPKGKSLGETSFLVEDFSPERLELKLAAADKSLDPAKGGTIDVKGRYLYGPPAAKLAIEGEVLINQRSGGIAGLAGYEFGLADENVSPVREALTDLPRTDAQGSAKVRLALPTLPQTSRLLQARVALRLREPGGRTIERNVTLPIRAARKLIGVKSGFESGHLGGGETATFDIILLDADGKRIAGKGLRWELLKVRRHFQWYSRNGSWHYEPVVYTRRVKDGRVDVAANSPGKIGVPVEWGSYRLEVSTDDPSGPVTSINFYAGWYAGKDADTPEVLEIGLDKKSYAPGDTAKLQIVPSSGGGKAFIAVMNDGLLDFKEVEVPPKGTSVALKIEESWLPGAYVTATLFRPMNVKAKRMPGRSIGVKWLQLDNASRTLAVELGGPKKLGVGETLTVPIKVKGLKAGSQARLVLAAVDVGVLNVTRYKPPAPESWFFAQRRLGIEFRDLYGRLIDGMRASKGRIRSGGDGGIAAPSGPPPSQRPVALFSHLVEVEKDGTATVSFKLPEFNGTIRLMAVAWSADKLGHATRDVLVRDPVAILTSAPRFLTLGDKTRLQLDLHNVEGPAGDYAVLFERLDAKGALIDSSSKTIKLSAGERKLAKLALVAKSVGRMNFAVTVTAPDNAFETRREVSVLVHPPAVNIKRRSVQSLAAGGTLSISKDILSDLIASRSKVTLSVGPTAGLDVPGLLLSLDRYPYGCAEQTTSRALPLLYLNTVAAKAGITGEAEAKKRVQAAIERLFEMQASNGAFGLWGPSNGEMWLTAYVTDFLTRAKELGYDVRPRPFNQALDRLQNFVSFATDFEKGGEAIAYALYVLARNGRAPIGDLRYYADTRLERFSTALARAQLGAALAMHGDTERAERAFESAVVQLSARGSGGYRADFGSILRDGAGLLTLVAETRGQASRITSLTRRLDAARRLAPYTSTQENAWLLLAARGLMERSKSLELSVAGAAHKGALFKSFKAKDLSAGPLKIVNKSSSPVDAVITVTGASATPEPAIARGFRIERRYYTLDGKEVDLAGTDASPATIKQNTRMVVVLKIERTKGAAGRVVVDDRLPAGFEIENPRIVDSASVASLTWLKSRIYPAHSEFRDDRFVAAFQLKAPRKGSPVPAIMVAYMVRAVSPGTFVHPAATVEDMYRASQFARTAAGRIEILAAAD